MKSLISLRLRSSRKRSYAWLMMALPIAVMGFAAVTSAAPPTSTDLKITKTGSPAQIQVGSSLTYTIEVQNLGANPASGVVVTDALPKGVDFVSATSTVGKCAKKGQRVTCAIGALGVGAKRPRVTIKVIPRQAGTISNTASVKGDQKDPVGSNDTATATTKVLGRTPSMATCLGVVATIKGTRSNDQLTGTGRRDVIAGFGGNDTIRSLAGNDLVCSGSGNDYVAAGSDADRVFGAGGRDRLVGQGGPDLILGGAANDVLSGGAGRDRLRGGAGFDRCRGGAGADYVRSCEA